MLFRSRANVYSYVELTGTRCVGSPTTDLRITTRDSWSLRGDIRYGRITSRVSFSELNLFGGGRTLSVTAENVDDKNAITPLRPHADLVKEIAMQRGELPGSGCLVIGTKGKLFAGDDYGSSFQVMMGDEKEYVDSRKSEACIAVPQSIPRASDSTPSDPESAPRAPASTPRASNTHSAPAPTESAAKTPTPSCRSPSAPRPHSEIGRAHV